MIIESKEVRIGGVSAQVTLYPDDHCTPSYWGADCYTTEAVADWEAGRWSYVGVALRTTMGEASAHGVEYGSIAGELIGFDEIVTDYGHDLLAEAYGI